MSSEKPIDPGEYNFDRLERFFNESRIDPVLKEMFDDISDIQDRVIDRVKNHKGDPSEVLGEELESMNDALLEEWEGVPMAISGRARIYDEDYYWLEDESDDDAAEGRSGSVLLSGEKYVCCGFDGSVGDDGNYDGGPIGLVIVPEKDYDGDVVLTSALILFEEDMDSWSIRFDKPSCRAIELDLKQGPDSLGQMIAGASGSRISDAAKTRYLQKFRIKNSYPELGADYPLQQNVGRYLYESMEFDDDVPYEIVVEGSIRAVCRKGDIEPHELTDDGGKPIKQMVKGYIEDIILEDDDSGSYMPTLVVAVPAPKGEMGWNGYLIGADSIVEPIRNTRPRKSIIGNVALRSFERAGDFVEFVKDTLYPQDPSMDPDEKFESILMGLEGNSWHDEVTYNPEKRRFETSLTEDIADLLQDFETFLGDPDIAISNEAIQRALSDMKLETQPNLRLQSGDKIEISGPVSIVGEVQGKAVGAHILSGTFQGINIVQINNSDLGIKDCRLTVVLTDCEFEGELGEKTGKASILQVFLSAGEQDVVKFVKIEPELVKEDYES